MDFFHTLIEWISSFWDTVLDALAWVFDGLLLILQFACYSIFDGILIVIESFFNTLDLSSIAFSYAAQWSNLPPQSIWFLNEIALPQALTILAGAYIIRLLLNLIPTWATRV